MLVRPGLIVLQPTPFCNIDCSYCYLTDRDNRSVMAHEVVAAVADALIRPSGRDEEPQLVVWHGGEPTTVPLRWYEQAYLTLRAQDDALGFSLQTNAVAIDDRWTAFLSATRTQVGVSIDGPQRFHDARRRTRTGRGSFDLAMIGLKRLQDAGCHPSVITVLSPDALDHADAFFNFYRECGIAHVSFSIDEVEGANAFSSFGGAGLAPSRLKEKVTEFILAIMRSARAAGFVLHVREVERIARLTAFGGVVGNEQVEAWAAVTIDHRGDVTTFSPEFTEVSSDAFANFRFGNVLRDSVGAWSAMPQFQALEAGIRHGIDACRRECRYFGVCGGGAPVNKWTELGTVEGTETSYCRLTTQASADALLRFLERN